MLIKLSRALEKDLSNSFKEMTIVLVLDPHKEGPKKKKKGNVRPVLEIKLLKA